MADKKLPTPSGGGSPNAQAETLKSLPLSQLIAAPFEAACEAQVQLALAQADFIDQIGMVRTQDEGSDTFSKQARLVQFSATNQAGEQVQVSVPLLSIVSVPSLAIREISVDFQVEIKTSSRVSASKKKDASVAASASGGWGPFRAKVEVSGSVSSQRDRTRSTDTSSKYQISVSAEDRGPPEGLSRLLEVLTESIQTKPSEGGS